MQTTFRSALVRVIGMRFAGYTHHCHACNVRILSQKPSHALVRMGGEYGETLTDVGNLLYLGHDWFQSPV